ncbi:MAG TPA: YafY family protein [Ktedonobacteraceae bacterium]|nr:YafY family protein [Ktedonobacteraceae bacterium]
MYFPTTRVLTILELLQSHARMSGPELARRLEVNTRTVRRYIIMLQDLGFPVEAERGRHGSYRLRPGFKLPPMMFTEDEALALTLGLLAARRLGLTSATPAVEGALAKIERVLPAGLRERVQAVQETLILDFANAGPTPRTTIVVTLCTSMQQERRVTIRYASFNEETTERAVDLYGLVYRPGYWYAVGYCHLRQDLRVFRLDRIVEAEMSNETYTRPADFDAVEYVTHSLAMTPATWPVEVLLDASLEEARTYVPTVMAELEETSNGLLLRCSIGNLDWFAHFLAGLPFSMTVRQPQELRVELQRLAARIAEMANRE